MKVKSGGFFCFYLFTVLTVLGYEITCRQALYHLSHTPNPFCFSYFSDGSCVFAHSDLNQNSPICYLQVAGTTGTHDHAQQID
jgi:hypothetical protein